LFSCRDCHESKMNDRANIMNGVQQNQIKFSTWALRLSIEHRG
jgi:hypothetical protein